MTIVRKSLLATALVLIVIAVGITWLVASESGTRWLLGRASGYLPQELELVDVRGSLLRGVSIASLDWVSEATRLQIGPTFVDIQLLPLFGRQLVIDELDVARVDVRMIGGGEPADDNGLPEVNLPLAVSIASSSVRQISIARGDVERTIDAIVLVARLRNSNLRLSKLELRSDWLDLDAHGQVQLADRYRSDIDAGWQWKDAEAGPFAGQLRIAGDLREYALNHTLATPVTVTSSGVISYESGSIDTDLLHEWASLEWPLEQRTLYSSRGTLRIKGNTDIFSLDLDANARLDDQPEVQLTLTGDANSESMRVLSFEAMTPHARLLANGDVRWFPGRSFDFTYKLAELDPAFVVDSIVGTIGLEGSVTGTINDDTPDIELQIARIDGDINGNSVQGSGALHLDGTDLSISDTQLQVGSNSVRVDGGLGQSLSLVADFDVANVAEIIPDAAGSIRGQVSLRGPRDRPDVQINMAGSAFAWQEYALDSLSAKANLFASEQGGAEVQLGRITIGDLELDAAQLSVSGQLAAHTLRASLRGLDSDLVVEATGGYDSQSWSGHISDLAIGNDVLDRWVSRKSSQLTASLNQTSLSQTCLFGPQGTDKVCLGGAYVAGGASSFDVLVSGVPLATIPAALPEGVTLRGNIHATLSGEWANKRLTANSDIEIREAAIDAVYDDENVSLTVPTAAGQLTVIDNSVESAIQVALADDAARAMVELSIEDFTDGLSALSGSAEVSVSDASPAAVVVPGIRDPRGIIDGRLTIAGSLNAPEFLGEITLTDGSFGVRQAGIEISDLDLRLAQLAPGQLRLFGSARSGDGQIAIEGQTEIGAETGVRSTIQLSGENFELARLPDWQIAASPAITVVFDERTAAITGDLSIPTANITVSEIPETAQSPSPDAVVHREASTPPEPARRIDIDVRTVLGDAVQFSGFGLTTRLDGTVRLQGGNQAVFTGQGRLDLRDGRYKAYGQELEIERGELIFNGPLENPRLNVRAIRRIDSVVAGIELSGTPTQLQSTVFSDPGMSDAEVLSYLLTGRPLASATSAGEGDTLNNAAFALGLSGAGSITSQVRTQLGLETLTIEGGAEDSRLIAGKRIGDRLLVEYGYGLIDKLGTLLLRYQLSDRLVLESRTGTVSNLDILYSVKKK